MQEQLAVPYSVERGREYTNWWDEIETLKQLKKKGEDNWTDKERKKYYELTDLAESWVTCACGNQCSILDRDDGVPIDSKLKDLGCDFAGDISDMDITQAKRTLRDIDKRSEYLIKEKLTGKS